MPLQKRPRRAPVSRIKQKWKDTSFRKVFGWLFKFPYLGVRGRRYHLIPVLLTGFMPLPCCFPISPHWEKTSLPVNPWGCNYSPRDPSYPSPVSPWIFPISHLGFPFTFPFPYHISPWLLPCPLKYEERFRALNLLGCNFPSEVPTYPSPMPSLA